MENLGVSACSGSGSGSVPIEISDPQHLSVPNQSQSSIDMDRQSVANRITSSSKRRRTSKVWNYFNFIKVDSEEKAECLICKQQFSSNSHYGTGTVTKHITKHHGIDINQTELLNKIKLFKYDTNFAKLELTKLIIVDEYPFSMLESLNFTRAIKKCLQPGYDKISRRSIQRTIKTLYDKENSKLINFILNNKDINFSITSDIWDSGHGDHFLCVTLHFIDEDWKICKRIIDFQLFNIKHTGENICMLIEECLNRYNISKRLISISFDNASNNNNAIIRLKRKIDPVLNVELFHIKCMCHVINLIVKDGLILFKDIIQKIKDAVYDLRHSTTKFVKFKELCLNANLKPIRIPNDVKTRWNSTYLMLSKAITLRLPLIEFINHYTNEDYVIEDEEFDKAEKLCEFLKYFYDITNNLSVIYEPTIHIAFPIIFGMEMHFKKFKNDPIFSTFISKMEIKFIKYWADIPLLFCIATSFDPRLKMSKVMSCLDTHYNYICEVVSNSQILVNDDNYKKYLNPLLCSQNKKNDLNETINKLYIKYKKQNPSRTSQSTQNSQNQNLDLTPSQNPFEIFLSASSSYTSSQIDLSERFDEIDIYKNMFRIDPSMNANFNILEWWSDKNQAFPILQLIARDILTPPVSTVPSEQAFSSSNRLLSPKRLSLTFKNIEMCIKLKDWFDAEIREQHQGCYKEEQIISEGDSESSESSAAEGN